MKRLTFVTLAGLAVLAAAHRPACGADAVDFSGTWVINRTLSQFPREVGFGMDLLGTAGGDTGEASEISRGGSGSPAFAASRSSEGDARNTKLLIAEVKRPPAWVKVVQTEAVISILDDSGRARSFHPNGREEVVGIDGGLVAMIASWERAGLVVRYRVSPGREVRYTYSRKPESNQLQVEVRLLERGGSTVITRVYEPLAPGASLPASAPATEPEPSPGPRGAGESPREVPASGVPGEGPIGSQKRDAELANITKLGLVVEQLTSQAAACGLDHATIEAAMSKSLGDKGFRVSRNADEDTYLYVDVVTVSVSNGLCVSRYDASLFTHTTATLTYQTRPALVRVLLLQESGIAGGAPKEHAERVLANLVQHVDKFGERIRAAAQ